MPHAEQLLTAVAYDRCRLLGVSCCTARWAAARCRDVVASCSGIGAGLHYDKLQGLLLPAVCVSYRVHLLPTVCVSYCVHHVVW